MQNRTWPCMIIRDPQLNRLWVSVDSLMQLRNEMGAQGGYPEEMLNLLDTVISTAQEADRVGRIVP